MILYTLVVESEAESGKDVRGLYEVQPRAWVVVQLQGLCQTKAKKPVCYLSVAYLFRSCPVS